MDLYPDGSSFTTVVVLVRGIASGTAVIRASAPPFIPEITATITVGSAGTRVPASITATGGTSQSAAVNNTFAAPLAVTVRMRAGTLFPESSSCSLHPHQDPVDRLLEASILP